MPFTIYFHGLMCFIGDEKDKFGRRKTHVAIIDETSHHNDETSHHDAWIKALGGTPSPIQKNDEITFSIGSAAAKTTPRFQAMVPHLQQLTEGGQLDGDIETPAPGNADVLAFVMLPGGTLDVHQTYEYDAQYTLGPDPIGLPTCVARINKLEVNTSAAVTITVTDKSPVNPRRPWTIAVPANGSVCIGNVSRQHAGRHLSHHRPLTNGTSIAQVDPTSTRCVEPDPGDPCSFLAPLDGANPECSNSQYP
jgi:hypothetical protein